MTAEVVDRLRRQIAALVPSDRRTRTSITTFLAALDRLPRPLDRDADPTHVTASAIVVGPRGTVLHRHKRLGLWLQPGGHIDPGESPEDAAVREAAEETGLPVEHPHAGGSPAPNLVHVDVHPAGGHVHLDLRYLLVAEDVEPRPGPDESPDVRWFGWDEAIAVADEALVTALREQRDVSRRSSSGRTNR